MPILFDYFKNDFKGTSIDWDLSNSINYNIPDTFLEDSIIKVRIIQGVENPIRMITFYISTIQSPFKLIIGLIQNLSIIIENMGGVTIFASQQGEKLIGERKNEYSNQLYFYTEIEATEQEMNELDRLSKLWKIMLTIRSTNYVIHKNQTIRPLAFISHDSRDKDQIARPIFFGLSSRLCNVWFDEFSLKIGDKLRDSIEKGIKEAKKCVLILTPHFLNNPGWTKKEFDSVYTRELIKNEEIFLPIWHQVTKQQIYEYCPELAQRVALIWPNKKGKKAEKYNEEVEKLISQLHTYLSK